MNARAVCLVATVLWLGGEAQAAGADWVGETLNPPPLAPGDRFGATLAIGNGMIVVGAYLSDARSSDAGGTDSGALFFYQRVGTSWVLLGDRTVLGRQAGDQLGFDLAIYVDAAGKTTLLAGAPFARIGGVRCGLVRRFAISATTFEEKENIVPPDGECQAGAEFGSAVAVQRGVVAAGARGADRRRGRIYASFNGEYVLPFLAAGVGEGDELGTSLATDGERLLAGAPFADAQGAADAGAAYVFVAGQSGRLVLPEDPQAGAAFGYSVALNDKYRYLAVGAPLEDGDGAARPDAGAVHRFSKEENWPEVQPVVRGEGARDQFGVSVSSGESGLFAGARRAGDRGAVYLVEEARKTPIAPETSLQLGAEFGFAVAIAPRGTLLVVGAFMADGPAVDSGVAYVFEQPQEVTVKLDLTELATCVFESELVPLKVTVITDDGRPTGTAVVVHLEACPDAGECTASGSDYEALDVTEAIPAGTPSGSTRQLAALRIGSDPSRQEPRTLIVRMSVDGRKVAEVQITIHDSPLVLPAGPLSTSESGGSTRFKVRLACQPAKLVRVSLSSSDASEASVAPTDLLFTTASWNRPQGVEVTGVDDPLCDGRQSYLLQVSTESADPRFGGLLPTIDAENGDDELACLAAAKAVCAYPDNTVVYTVELSNEGPARVAAHLEDPLPFELSVVTASADSGVATVDYLENSVVWDGIAPAPGDRVTITVVAALDPVPAGTDVGNQATLSWRDSSGSTVTAPSDDPATPEPADATFFDALAGDLAVGCPP